MTQGPHQRQGTAHHEEAAEDQVPDSRKSGVRAVRLVDVDQISSVNGRNSGPGPEGGMASLESHT
jgi:hypothetical protein